MESQNNCVSLGLFNEIPASTDSQKPAPGSLFGSNPGRHRRYGRPCHELRASVEEALRSGKEKRALVLEFSDRVDRNTLYRWISEFQGTVRKKYVPRGLPPHAKKPHPRKEEALRLYLNGVSAKSIADEVGRNVKTIYAWIREAGHQRSRGRPKYGRST